MGFYIGEHRFRIDLSVYFRREFYWIFLFLNVLRQDYLKKSFFLICKFPTLLYITE